MEWRPKLSTYFTLVAVLVICIIGWVAYASRTNAAANIWDGDKDVSSPFYSNHSDVNDDPNSEEQEKVSETREGHGKSDAISGAEEKGDSKDIKAPQDSAKEK